MFLRCDLPRLVLVPGILAMIEGWLKECVNLVTVIAGFAAATVVTVLNNQVEDSVPVALL